MTQRFSGENNSDDLIKFWIGFLVFIVSAYLYVIVITKHDMFYYIQTGLFLVLMYIWIWKFRQINSMRDKNKDKN